jgi:hypothetical protein
LVEGAVGAVLVVVIDVVDHEPFELTPEIRFVRDESLGLGFPAVRFSCVG